MLNQIKKFIPFILILIISIGFFSFNANAQTPSCVDRNGNAVAKTEIECKTDNPGGRWNGPDTTGLPQPTTAVLPSSRVSTCPEGQVLTADFKCYNPKENYVLLAPIPCKEGTPNCDADGKLRTYNLNDSKPLGSYLNTMITIFIGLCGVLAIIMIVMGGLEYMTSELISEKESGKQKITNAVLGLILALGSWALLYTINPDLLNTDSENLTDVKVTVTLDEENFAKTEQSIESAGKGFKLSGSASAGVTDFVNNHLKKGESIKAITVDTNAKRAYFYIGGPNEWDKFITVPINTGFQGIAPAGQGKPGDGKTPIGTTSINGDIRISRNNDAITNKSGQYNLGSAFISIDAARGIGFHGSANNSLGTTNGCIRMTNDDLLALAPYMKSGVQVIIK